MNLTSLNWDKWINERYYVTFLVTATYQFYFNINVPRLTLYVGPGTSIGLFLDKRSIPLDEFGRPKQIGDKNLNFHISINAIAGIEYKLKYLPRIALSLDWTPKLNLINEYRFLADYFDLGVKYIF